MDGTGCLAGARGASRVFILAIVSYVNYLWLCQFLLGGYVNYCGGYVNFV